MNYRHAISRRTFLKGAGLASLALVAGGGLGRAIDQGVFSIGQGHAYSAWDSWRVERSPLALVRAAILAANPDNSQPWLFRVTERGGQVRVDLFADLRRNLKAIDPYQRNVHIGLGCALENLLLAAGANSYATDITLAPDAADVTHVARVDLAPAGMVVPDLYWAIPQRHMNRAAFDTNRPLGEDMLAEIQALNQDDPDARLFWFTTAGDRRCIGDLIVEATEATIHDTEQAADIVRWSRMSWQDVLQHKDGITLDTSGVTGPTLAVAKMLPTFTPEQSNQAWLKNTRETHVVTAATFCILAVRDKSAPVQQLRAGRLLQRVHLWSTVHGLALHVMHQMPDRAGREESLGIEPRFGHALRDLIGNPAWQALSMFRMGYPTVEALRSPRLPVEQVLIS